MTPLPTEDKRSSKRPWPKWDWNLSPESIESPSKKEKPLLSALMTLMYGKLPETKADTLSLVSPTWMVSKVNKELIKLDNIISLLPLKDHKKHQSKKLQLKLPRLKNQPKISMKKVWLLTTSRWSWTTQSAPGLRQSRLWEKPKTIQWMQSWSLQNDVNSKIDDS